MPAARDAQAVFATDLNLPGKRRGKVRDTYTLPRGGPGGEDAILMIASDRLSAFDVVMPTPIPGKGRLLTEIAAFWLRMIEAAGLGPTHLISTDDGRVPDSALTDSTGRAELQGRTTIGRKCVVVPVECVVRGYLEGSGWKDYQRTGSVCGVELPGGLRQCDRLPEPIFTPATKAEEGHDENIGFEAACEHAEAFGGRALIERLRERSLAIYRLASEHAASRGIILADTKFEFGLPLKDGRADVGAEPILIDEALTPDSSRFWPADAYEPGRSQASFDKQFVREYLEGLVASGSWDKTPPGPALPEHVVAGTLARYREARDRLLG
ncbi:MAG: phosphoribosylaminoimidazolesuccinocarboxamide synthase [Planctomycetota bacterium]|nr:MAG: phosphoribosylaminoimidazolesuccinocarboxamide synthase [Planctomycetota bacterium]